MNCSGMKYKNTLGHDSVNKNLWMTKVFKSLFNELDACMGL